MVVACNRCETFPPYSLLNFYNRHVYFLSAGVIHWPRNYHGNIKYEKTYEKPIH